jgi:lipopolysaccharide/colanic/teichoic acid biosynthesis glycosyltransferase
MEQRGWRLLVKKTFDRSVAAVGLVTLAPLLGVAAVAVRVSMGAPVLFRQTRPGHKTKRFELVKFRTMKEAYGPDGRALPDAERMTRVGTLLRQTSIDELPQLLCVLRGDLSLVGPRPLLVEYLDRYTASEMRRHDVMPGITGLPAVSGRNALSWDDRFRLDGEYVDNWSLMLDAKILLKTAWKVLGRKGVSMEGHATSPELRPQNGAR